MFIDFQWILTSSPKGFMHRRWGRWMSASRCRAPEGLRLTGRVFSSVVSGAWEPVIPRESPGFYGGIWWFLRESPGFYGSFEDVEHHILTLYSSHWKDSDMVGSGRIRSFSISLGLSQQDMLLSPGEQVWFFCNLSSQAHVCLLVERSIGDADIPKKEKCKNIACLELVDVNIFNHFSCSVYVCSSI